MKKTMIMIAAAVLWLSASSFAANVNEYVTEKALTAFAKDFSGASSVNWEEKGSFYIVGFKVGDVTFNAAYNEEGELLASSKSLELDELPLAVTEAINKKYMGYEIGNNAAVLNFEGQTYYYLTIANNKQVLQVKVSETGRVTTEKKTKL